MNDHLGIPETETNDDESTALTTSSTKRWGDKTWKEKRKTRFCGVPLGWILLVVGVLAFVVIVLASVIGSFLDGATKRGPKGSANHSQTQTQSPQ